jgi:glycosyltransferase involved in cell wall biosynthesis
MPDVPTVSVVVPNYNYARYMPERLGSIFRQTLPVHEVIVLDDVSTDDSLTVIPAIAADWKRDITLIPNEKNSGSVFAQWRKAAEVATGEWIWIAEADDSSSEEFLALVMSLAASDPEVVMAFSDSRTIHVDGSAQWESYKGYYDTVEAGALARSEVFDGASFAARFLSIKNLIMNVSSVVWKRSALLAALDACGEDLKAFKMAGDWKLYLTALSAPGAKIAYEAVPLNVHRRHAGSVTHALAADKHLAEIRTCHAIARSLPAVGSKIDPEKQSKYLDEAKAYLMGSAPAIPEAVQVAAKAKTGRGRPRRKTAA